VVDRRVISPAQVIAGMIGLALVVIGGVAAARVGLDSLTGDSAVVLGFEHTALMGLIDIFAGLLFLVAAASYGGRGSLLGLGMASLAFGAVLFIEPAPFVPYLGGGEDLGLLYGVIGAVALLAAWAFPVTVVDRVATEDDDARVYS
jgi:hypothetical protein